DPACAVCGRRLLPGERAIEFVTGAGAGLAVCELCKPRAEAAGWLRPEDVAAAGASAGTQRRRGRGGGVIGGLLSSWRLPDREADGSRVAEPDPGEGEGVGSRRAPAPAPGAEPAGTSVADAVAAFNRSNHRRTVAGLTRTLGSPRATALIRKGNGGGTVRLTIAWEITWYQWEVAPAGRGHEVRESGKGDTIDQLGAPDRAWNLMVAVDGTLEEKTSMTAPVEEP
ncbi:MAG: hypothetical protein KJ006_11835, partial [Thermoleophilia bacterium]|nr:hypothetical protein [Thermoleophilia bacterium]